MSDAEDPKPPMYNEVNALFGTIAEAFKLDAEALAKALEDGSMTLDMGEDDKGERFVAATLTRDGQSRTCRIFKDGIHGDEA